MSIFVEPQQKDYPIASAGLYQAVCVDAVDLGIVETLKFGSLTEKESKHKVRLIWELDTIEPESGKPFTVSKAYNLSLHEKATLRKDLKSWRGRDMTPAELDAKSKGRFDVESVIGANAQILVAHNESRDGSRTYANVESLMPISAKTTPIKASTSYVRVKDREDTSSTRDTADTYVDDGVPF